MREQSRSGKAQPVIREWLVERPPPEVQRSINRLARAPDVAAIAVMPDVHLSGDVCVGLAVATNGAIYPQAVGGDIGCGMTTVSLGVGPETLDEAHAARLLAQIRARAPAMRHRSRADAPDPIAAVATISAAAVLSDPHLRKLSEREGRVEFATLGRGNHFVELQRDEAGEYWLLVHSGSRAMGQTITARYLAAAQRVGGGLFALRADEASGAEYLAAVDWACAYAEASRRRMLLAAAEVVQETLGLAADWQTMFSCCHNHVRSQTIDGAAVLVHRKGANPASLDAPGIIAGSMGTQTVHTLGRGCEDALYSSSHGAGRLLSRGAAKSAISPRELHDQMRGVWFDARLTAELCDEAPSAYRDLKTVLRAQRDLIRVTRRLRPVLVYKGV